MDLTIKTIIKTSHEIAKSKGWWNPAKTFGEQIAIFHTELSEALEEYRKGKLPNEVYYSLDESGNKKPEGVPVELADLIIRIGDTCAFYSIDLEQAIREKMQYNTNRSHRHGNKLL